MDICIKPSKAEGTITLPPSKSQTYRAMIFGAFASGSSCIENYLEAPDTDLLIKNLEQLGAKISKEKGALLIQGNHQIIPPPADLLNVGNSGINFRFLTAICATSPFPFIIDGDSSIRQLRTISPLLSALQEMGVFCASYSKKNAPLMVKGPFAKNSTEVEGNDSQFVSALLIAFALSQGTKSLSVISPGEIPWVELTLSWLDRLGITYTNDAYQYYRVEGAPFLGFRYKVPSDFSTASYPIAAALISKSIIRIEGLDFSEPQADKNLIPLLQSLGAHIEVHVKEGALTVHGNKLLEGGTVDINSCIDCLPLLACLGTYAQKPLTVFNGEIARTKECDRIACITNELRKMGAHIEEHLDGFKVSPSPLKGGILSSYNDHRMALSLSVAALGASTPTTIQNAGCIEKTYKHFVEEFQHLGADLSCYISP